MISDNEKVVFTWYCIALPTSSYNHLFPLASGLFAPTDDAFAKLTAGTHDAFLMDHAKQPPFLLNSGPFLK